MERYSLLKRWRELAAITARACREVAGDCEVYVVGGAVEDRLTVLSDIDVVAMVEDPALRTIDVVIAVKRRAEELGLPEDAPIDLKIFTPQGFQELLERGVYKKAVRIEP
ncbi:DNA polymerase III subunit beta [Pyrobaculum aerophilum]|uniref:DNA polymerase III subunit beta n=1 Tax=Pyrobaculum aerophilum TaxID=13773 RepID=UPI002FDABD15